MRPIVLAIMLVVLPVLGGTPKAAYKKFTKADVIRVYGEPLAPESKALARQAESRLEAAEILLDIYQNLLAEVNARVPETMDKYRDKYPREIVQAIDARAICREYIPAVEEVIAYYRKVDKR